MVWEKWQKMDRLLEFCRYHGLVIIYFLTEQANWQIVQKTPQMKSLELNKS